MAKVFISHAGADTYWAEQVHLWLKEDGHDAFLDRDIDDGVLPGEEWEERLYAEMRKADAVVCVVTESYLTSVWCTAEIGAARGLGTELLPVSFSTAGQIHSLLKPIHSVDAARDPSDARERLRLRLSVIDGGGGWGWPDDKSPYPGLRPFDLGEHRVFFGRHRDITQIAELLRSPERAAREILTVVGASGCGKSSLIRAGLLPRIDGEDYWLPVRPILPGTDPLGSLVRAIAASTRERHISFDVTSLRSDLNRDGLKAIATDLLLAAGAESRCKLLIVIDQFEELLTQTAPAERAEFATALVPALGGPVQVLATLRPEFLDPLAKDPDLSQLTLRIHPIRPLDSEALRSVIEEPAKVAGLSFEEDLVTHLATDTGSGDALPLLAFTLEQLAHGAKRGDQLTHQRYADIGGVQGALQRQADAALDDACTKAGVKRDQVISALLDLVTIDEQGTPTKRREALDEFSSGVTAELDPFVTRRLLSTEAVGERTFVAVAHEAFLVNWPPLKDQIDAHATALRTRRQVENAAEDWNTGGRDKRALMQGPQLTKARADLGAKMKLMSKVEPSQSHSAPPAVTRQGVLDQLRGEVWPDHRRLVTRVDLNDTGREFLEASIRRARWREWSFASKMWFYVFVFVVINNAWANLGFDPPMKHITNMINTTPVHRPWSSWEKDQGLNGTYTLQRSDGYLSMWLITSTCGSADSCVADVHTFPIGVGDSTGYGKAQLRNGQWTMTINKSDGHMCRDKTRAPSHDEYSWSSSTLSGTLVESWGAVCGDAPDSSPYTFTLTIGPPPMAKPPPP